MERLSDNAEARAERLTDKSGRLAEQARAHHEKARQIADTIPIGQPVLTDHYSARRHRGDIGRIRDGYSKAFAASSEADRLVVFRDDQNHQKRAVSGNRCSRFRSVLTMGRLGVPVRGRLADTVAGDRRNARGDFCRVGTRCAPKNVRRNQNA